MSINAFSFETWKPIPGFRGHYSVSNLGRVRSENRVLTQGNGTRTYKSRLLKASPAKNGYPFTHLALDGVSHPVYVHHLVALAFIGPRPVGQWVRHLDDNKLDCRVENLAYGTPTQNCLDAVRNGRNANSNKTHCLNGHEFTPENTYPIKLDSGETWRACRTCAIARAKAHKAKKKAEKTATEVAA